MNPQPELKWFGPTGAVEWHEDGSCSVYVGGSLLGEYSERDPAMRDTLIVLVSRDRRVRPGQVAAAFGVCTEVMRKAKARVRQGGIGALSERRVRGAPQKVTASVRKRLYRWFDEGYSIQRVTKLCKGKPSYGTIRKAYHEWQSG